jgi:hypothetical protein
MREKQRRVLKHREPRNTNSVEEEEEEELVTERNSPLMNVWW